MRPLLLLLTLSLLAGRLSVSADPLVQRAMEQQSRIAYEGTRVSITWGDNREHATVTREYCDGQGRSRVEYLAPKKLIGHVLIDDGRFQWHSAPRHHVVFKAVAPNILDPRRRWDLLQKNYRIETKPVTQLGDHMPTVEVVFHPKTSGKPLRRVWIDPASGFIVKSERYHIDHSLAAVSHFLSLRLHNQPSQSLFSLRPLEGDRIVEQGPQQVTYSSEELKKTIAGFAPVPESLPGNYVFENATIVGRSLAHKHVTLHFSDGLNTLSLVETLDSPTRILVLPDALRISARRIKVEVGGHHHLPVACWAAEHQHFTLMGDVSQEFITRVASDLASQSPPPAVVNRVWRNLLRIALIAVVLLLAFSACSLLRAYRSRQLPVPR